MMSDPPAVPAGTGETPRFDASDRTILLTIADLFEADSCQGLNLPGVARLIRRALSATPEPPQARQPREDDWQRVAAEYERRMDMSSLRANQAEAALLALREGLEQKIERFRTATQIRDLGGIVLDGYDADGWRDLRPIEKQIYKACADELQSLLAAPQDPR